jgi:hypothetical protein
VRPLRLPSTLLVLLVAGPAVAQVPERDAVDARAKVVAPYRLDLEKQFGVKLVDPGQRPTPSTPARRRGPRLVRPEFTLTFDWWYVAGGVQLLSVVGLFVFSRRWGRP